MSTTRARYAKAVDEAHEALHEASDANHLGIAWDAIRRAHDALHRVGAGTPRVDCATPDPEAQRLYAELRECMKTPMACGHTLDDLVAGADTVTFCGACQVAKKAGQPYGVIVSAEDRRIAADDRS